MALLLVYTPQARARIRYALETVCRDLMGCDLLFTDEPGEIIAHPGPKLVYAPEPLSGCPFIWQHPLMREQGLRKVDLDIFEYQGFPAFFQAPYAEALMPFDIFAAAFYRLSRYDEYLPFKADAYGRFPLDQDPLADQTLVYPVLDYWAKDLSDRLQELFPSLSIERPPFRFRPTFDVDQAFAYRARGPWRQLGAWLKDLLAGRWRALWERPCVLLGWKRDPYDTYAWILKQCETHHIDAHFFILQGSGPLDRAISLRRKIWRKTLNDLDTRARLGYHPSMASNQRPQVFRSDVERLRQAVKQPISSARQHYLFLNIPHTFRQLVDIGIQEDYSLLYPNALGFRAGTCRSFNAFDISCDQVLPLRLLPACAMDRTCLHMGLNPEQALQALQTLGERVRDLGGDFICVFHNETFSERGPWRGWRRVFETLLNDVEDPIS